MRVPAAPPAIAILLGTAAACFFDLPLAVAALVSVAGVATAVACFLRCAARAATAAALAAIFAAAWGLAAPAFRDAEAPPLADALRQAVAAGERALVRGRLRSDASPSRNGVSLDLDVESRGAHGGVRLTVAGSLAAGLADGWRAGRTIEARASLRVPGGYRDPGVPDGRLDLARRGTVLLGSVKSGALVGILSPGGWFEERAATTRALARAAIDRYVGRWSRRSAAIVIAILIGDRAGLDDEVQRRLREAGTYHVIAISGGNIAILAAVMLFVLRVCRVPARAGCWAAMAGLGAYAFLVGGGASVVRATLMAVGYLLARQADHRSPPLNALAVACGLILLFTPLALCDVGFALTFGATLGILVGASAMARSERLRPGRWLRAPAALVLASLSAELALFPVSAWSFSRVTFAGLGLNLLAVPLMSVAQIAGMCVLPLSHASSTLASWAGFVAHVGADGLVRTAALVDLAPWLSRRLPPPPVLAIACYYGGWCAWLWARRLESRRASSLAAVAVICISGLWILVEPVTLLFPGVSGRLRVAVLDVGHADAILIQLPDRRSLLVDAGGSTAGGSFDIGGRVIAPALWALGTRRLDALILSHGDPDHIGGAASVVRDFSPREIWEGIGVAALPARAALQQLARDRGIPWIERRAGERLVVGDVTVSVWHPPPAEWERRKVRNDDSLVLELRYGDVSVVLPGDIGRDVERGLARSVPPALLRILKVPHHGSASSSSTEFLEALHPALAILSAGPMTKVAGDVLERYRSVGATVLRTSDAGAITLTTDGHSLSIETFGGKRLDLTTKNTKTTKTDNRRDVRW